MRLNDFDLNLLKTFVVVAEKQSFTQAAKTLFIEQSSVSKAIKRLEENIGTVLFQRTKRHVQLTTKGLGLLSIARQVLQSSDELLRVAQDKELELSGTLRFGAASPYSFLFMPEVILEISKDYPRLWPMMFTGMTDDIVRRVKNRELEFAVLGYEGDRLKELEYREIGHCQFRVVRSAKITPEAMNSFIGSREIHDQNSPKLPTFERLKRINKDLRIKYSANDMTAYKALVLNGLGIGILPESLIASEIKSKKLKVLHPEMKLSFPLLLAHHASYPLSLEAQRMIEILKEKLQHRRET